MIVNCGNYTPSRSSGAPAIYNTADITVNHATLIAYDSEAILAVECFNSVTLNDCDVTDSHGGTHGESKENTCNVMLYQSTSGDTEMWKDIFTMPGGSLWFRRMLTILPIPTESSTSMASR